MAERQTQPTRPEEPMPGQLQPISYQFTITNTIALEASRQVIYPNDPFRKAVKSLRTPTHFFTSHTDSLEVNLLRNKGLLRAMQGAAILLLLLYFFFTLQILSTAQVPMIGAYSSAGLEPEFQPKPTPAAQLGLAMATTSATDKHKVVAERKVIQPSTVRKTGSSLSVVAEAAKEVAAPSIPATPEISQPIASPERKELPAKAAVLTVVEEEVKELEETPVVIPASPVVTVEAPVPAVIEEQPEQPLVVEQEQVAAKPAEPVVEAPAVPESALVVESLELIKESAIAEGKLFFLKFGAKWCLPCKVMEKTTFQDETLKGYIADHYLSMKVDVDDFDGYNLKQIYQIKALPTILIFNAQGEVLARYEESMSASKLLKELELHNQPKYRIAKTQSEPAMAQTEEKREEIEQITLEVKQILDARRMMK